MYSSCFINIFIFGSVSLKMPFWVLKNSVMHILMLKGNCQIAEFIQNGICALFDLSNSSKQKSTRNCNGSQQYMNGSTLELFENLITRCPKKLLRWIFKDHDLIRRRYWIKYLYVVEKHLPHFFRTKLPAHQSKPAERERSTPRSLGLNRVMYHHRALASVPSSIYSGRMIGCCVSCLWFRMMSYLVWFVV